MTATTTSVPVEVDYGPSAGAVAAEASAWLADHAHEAGGHGAARGVTPRGVWVDRLREARWLCLGWPEQYGGRGLSGLEAAAVDAEFSRAGVSRPTLGMGGVAGGAGHHRARD